MGERLALAARAAVYGEKVTWQGPEALSAKGAGPGEVEVRFSAPTGALSLASGLACPPPTAGSECTGAGFELRVGGAWRLAASARLRGTDTVVVSAAAAAAAPDRVRYAYAAWPLCPVRNSAGGLPARVFDINVTA